METNDKQKTPLMELIDYVDLLAKCAGVDHINLENIRNKAKSLLPREREVIERAWENGCDYPHNEPMASNALYYFNEIFEQ